MSEQELLFEKKGMTAWLTLNREASRNSINAAMLDLFNKHLDQIETDDSVRSVCLTGAGEKVFCSGADLMGARSGDSPVDAAKKYANLLKRLVTFEKPIVAKLNGHCMAGGMGLMLASDIIYAHDGVKIGTPEVGVGLFPMMIGALIFKSAMRKKALEMIYTAKLYPVKEAEAMGLVTRVYEAAKLDDAVDTTLNAINANAPKAIAIGRTAFAKADEMTLEDGLDYLCNQLGAVLQTEDAAEGMSAFFGKRKPEWKNR